VEVSLPLSEYSSFSLLWRCLATVNCNRLADVQLFKLVLLMS
jgi:hypothetical protein